MACGFMMLGGKPKGMKQILPEPAAMERVTDNWFGGQETKHMEGLVAAELTAELELRPTEVSLI